MPSLLTTSMIGLVTPLIASLSCLVLPSSSFHTGGCSSLSPSLLLRRQHSLTSTLYLSTTIPQLIHECNECTKTFQSRNALFRHIKDAHMEIPDNELLLTTVIIRYGYFITTEETNHDGDDSQSNTPTNEFVANIIHESFQHCLSKFMQNQEGGTISEVTTTALTYASAAKNRQPSLRQDSEVIGATSEVLSFNFKLGCTGQVIKQWKEYASSGQLYDNMQSWLETKGQIYIHRLDALVPRSKKFFAERGCSQRSYRYILPLRWILYDDSGNVLDDNELDQVHEWWKMIIARSSSTRPHKHQNRGSQLVSPPDFIKRLKRSLKAVESETIPNRRLRRQIARVSDDDENSMDDMTSIAELDTTCGRSFRLSPGRFGQLWRKERRCWSNFCHPSLKGLEASPGHEAVWRTMDRSKIVGFTAYGNDGDFTQNMNAIIEFCGDGFVLGQIPRILSSVVAMTNGWIPSNFFDHTTKPDVYLPAPPMMPFLRGRLYYHVSRYHFHELTAIGNSKTDLQDPVNSGTDREISWEMNLREILLKEVPHANNRVENEWLLELRDNSRVVQIEMEQMTSVSSNQTCEADDSILQADELNDLSPAPDDSYNIVLNQLRDIANSKRWPVTSGARSKVIKAPASSEKILATKKGAVASVFPGVSSGSFTIVNDELLGPDSGIPLPNANCLFPDLVRVVFELEKRIINQNEVPLPGAEGMQRTSPLAKRLPSTHCAVNRNAQFTPHVDSGRGQGQTLSMICGLGDYTGGETIVENRPYDIRYKPLEFNGWKQLHWTAPFTGERFSLVFFTPANKLDDDQLNESMPDTASEDDRAAILAKEHSNLVSSILKPLRFRPNSTDALVIMELLQSEKCAYESTAYDEIQEFSLKDHAIVLDIGAHIGVFSRLALSKGCKHIIAYEPEPCNFQLLSENLETGSSNNVSLLPIIELHSKAVAHGSSIQRKLVRARNQNDGTQNTWRHSLEEYSQYVDKLTELPSASQRKVLERIDVTSVPLFGRALVAGVTLVKLDCEGAEIDILISEEASRPESWLDVTDLVVEWSFTKERRVSVFHRAVRNLEAAGFTVFYEGSGSWWDTDKSSFWPYEHDLVIFACRRS